MRLGSRQDLTVTQRETVQTIWANWAVRRAGVAIDNNDNERAVEILEAAALAFPDSIQVERVLAGGYLKTGEARLALSIYKKLPTQDASAADFQGAIGAALAANDKTQAEVWLRQALERFPKDYQILESAARFEQARGDNQRAADYWRASIAAMPQGTPTDRLAHDLAYPDANTKPHKAVTAGDLQRLLDPGYEATNDRFQKTVKLPPLPAYGPDPYLGTAPVILGNQPNRVAQETELPTAPPTTQVPVPAQHTAATPQAQTAAQGGTPAPASVQTGPDGTQRSVKPSPKHHRNTSTSQQSGSTGQVHLPPSEENINTTDGALPAQSPPSQASQPEPVWIPPTLPQETAPQPPSPPQDQDPVPPTNSTPPAPNTPAPNTKEVPPVFIPAPQSSVTPPDAGSQPALRISSAPMDARAAQVQAQFADQTDGQLTQGSAAQIRSLENAPVTGPGNPASTPTTHPAAAPVYNEAQYTPSAQEAATGAYSAQKQGTPAQNPAPGQTPAATQQPAPQQPPPATSGKKKKRKKTAEQTVPTLVTAPTEPGQAPPPTEEPAQATPQDQNPQGGATDEELQQQNLPPLRGPWVRVQRQPQPLSPRDEAEQQLRSLESGYSGWLGGAGAVDVRSGNAGYDRLAALQAPFEFSAPLGYHMRFTFVAKPVFLDSGQADGTAQITVQESTTSGRSLVVIPEPLGTDLNTGPSTTTTTTAAPTPPAQQNAAGIGGEVQFTLPNFAVAAGYTPFGFLVANWTARAQWRPGNGPFTFSVNRDAVKDTQLSYGGLRDPGNATLSYPGSIWGGVVANQGNVQFSRGDALSGFYVGVGGQYLTGYQVETNSRVDGSGGAYWRIWTRPEYGTLSIGANFFAMHYAHNEQAYTLGMGGYFSPQDYFLANVPVTWVGHYLTHWHYEILGGLGVQAFQQELTPLFPLAAQKASEVAINNAELPALTSVGPNYNLRGNVAYQIGPHWFAGAFVSANNSRNYETVSVGFSIHYIFRSQPSTVTAPTGLFPADGFRPFTVP
jgi:hypothetical protein